MRIVIVAALLLLTPVAEARDEALVRLLSGIEWVPGPQDLASRRIDASDLIALYGDARVPTVVQIRAVELLVHFPEPAVKTFLDGVVRAPGQIPALLRGAAASLVPFGDASVPTLARLLCHPDHSVREAAARALGSVRTPAAWDALRRRRPREREAVVLRAIDVALAAAPLQ
jgi:HEAT repeat protein